MILYVENLNYSSGEEQNISLSNSSLKKEKKKYLKTERNYVQCTPLICTRRFQALCIRAIFSNPLKALKANIGILQNTTALIKACSVELAEFTLWWRRGQLNQKSVIALEVIDLHSSGGICK